MPTPAFTPLALPAVAVALALPFALAEDCAENPTPYPCAPAPVMTPSTGFFVDISEASGIRVGNYDEDPPEGTVINDHSRLAFADINGDGFDDIVMHSLFPNAQNGVPFEHLVFLNNGDGTFRDHSDASGLRDVQAGFFAFGDVDNDGDQDIFAGLDIAGYADYDHQILLNNGAGVFTALANSGVEGSRLTAAANAVFADFDADGKLDLYIGQGSTFYAVADAYYEGHGDGTFTRRNARIADGPAQPSNGSITCDFDQDGDQDIFVSTYGVSANNGLNVLWQNDGPAFSNVATAQGFASLATGNYYLAATGYGTEPEPGADPGGYVGSNGFGLDCGDVDNDGDLDIFLTAISHPVASDYLRMWSDPSQLLINQGAAGGYVFHNEFLARGLPFNEGDVDGAMVDFDNDGRLDLSISRDRKYEGNYDDAEQKSWFGLMWQRPDGSFDSVGTVSGINDLDAQQLHRMKGAQNHAWSDIDRDGDLDLLVGGRDQGGGRPNFLFRNDIGHQNRYLAVEVEGDGLRVNRDGIGTRLSLIFSDETLTREKKGSRGTYNSEDTRVQHFGLGGRSCDYTMRVQWPDGVIVEIPSAALPGEGYVRLTYPGQVEVL